MVGPGSTSPVFLSKEASHIGSSRLILPLIFSLVSLKVSATAPLQFPLHFLQTFELILGFTGRYLDGQKTGPASDLAPDSSSDFISDAPAEVQCCL